LMRKFITYRLYLPEVWANDSQLRQHAKIPNDIVFQTKVEIALGQIRQAIADGVPQGTVLADPAYGYDTGFRKALAELGRIRPAKYTVDCGAIGMREVFRRVLFSPGLLK